MGLLETDRQKPSHGFVWNRGPPNGLLGTEAPPRVCWEQRNGGSYFRWWGTKEQMPKINGKRRRKIIVRNREHWKSNFWFGGTWKQCNIFQGYKTGIGLPSPLD